MQNKNNVKELKYFSFKQLIARICVNCPDILKCGGRYDSNTCRFSSVLDEFGEALCETDEALKKAVSYQKEMMPDIVPIENGIKNGVKFRPVGYEKMTPVQVALSVAHMYLSCLSGYMNTSDPIELIKEASEYVELPDVPYIFL